jgi:hypothetical protein
MSLVAFAIGFLAGTTFGFFYLLSFTPVRTGSRGVDIFWFRQTDNRFRSLGVGTGGAARDV